MSRASALALLVGACGGGAVEQGIPAAPGGELARWRELGPFAGGVADLALAPDTSALALALRDGGVLRVELAGDAAPRRADAHLGGALAVAFSPDGGLLASGGADGTVCLFDSVTLAPEARLAGAENRVLSLAFEPDGARLAAGSGDAIVRLWDVRARELVGRVDVETHHVTGLAWSPEGSALAIADGYAGVHLWDAASGALTALAGVSGTGVAFAPDGRALAAFGYARTVDLWLRHGAERAALDAGHARVASRAAFLAGGELVIGGADGLLALAALGAARGPRELGRHAAPIAALAVALGGSGDVVASADAAGRVVLWRRAH